MSEKDDNNSNSPYKYKYRKVSFQSCCTMSLSHGDAITNVK